MIHRFVESAPSGGTPFWVTTQIYDGSDSAENQDIYSVPLGAPAMTTVKVTAADMAVFGSGAEFYGYPIASPDRSKLLATYSDDAAIDRDLVTMNPDGSGEVTVNNAGGTANPTWLGNNKLIYTTAFVTIRSVNVDGTGGAIIITEDGISGFHAAPDGSQIAVRLTDGADSQLAVFDPDGTNKNVLVSSGVDGGPVWTLDGSQILYGQSGDTKLINPDGTGATTILAGGFPGFLYAEGMATDRMWYTDTSTFANWRPAYFMLDGSGSTIVTPNRRLSQAVQRGVCIWDESQGRMFSVIRFSASPSGADEVFSILPDGSDYRSHFVALEESPVNPGDTNQGLGFR